MMDYQEAIEVINNHERYVGVKYVNGVEEAYVTPYFENALNTAISAMQELQEYKQLGTLEEVREAVEKQREKKPKNVETEGYRHTDTYRCPTCGGNFSGTGIADYCYHCGQRLNWE